MLGYRMAALAAMVLATGAAACGQTADDFFDDSVMQEIRLEVRPSDYATLKQNYLLNTYYPANMQWKFNGRYVAVSNIGIRSRGRGSRSPDKPNLRLDFNHYESGQKLFGLSSAVLKSNNQDGSMLRERTVMKLWGRTGLPASREAYCRLYVNDQYQGLYLLVEEIRNAYAERYLGDKDGDLYKFDPINEGYHWEWIPTCASSAQLACSTDPTRWAEEPFNPEENKSTYDITTIIRMIRDTTTASDADFERVVSPQIDFRYMASYIAMENFTADYDSFLGDVFGMNNFFLYRYKGTTLHQIVPWDKDAAYAWIERPLFRNADANVLMRRILAIPSYRARYVESAYIVAQLAGGAGGWLAWEHEREYNQGRASVYEDTLKQYSVGGELYPNTNEIYEQEVEKNRQWLQGRTPFVLQEVAAAGWQPSGAVTINAGGVVNSATGVATTAAPGSYISIYGSGFTSATQAASSTPFPETLGGVTVVINGFLAPISFVSQTQINVQAPWELGMGNGTAPVSVIVNGTAMKGTRAGSPINGTISNAVNIRVGHFAPGVFAVTQSDGRLTTARPAAAGDTLVIYANGLGPIEEDVATGAPAPLDHVVRTSQTPTVLIGGVVAPVKFSGLAPGLVGCYQVNVEVPAGVRSGNAPLFITISGEISTAYTIAMR